jgi:homoserine trans-succinylase
MLLTITTGQYIYHSIATNLETLSDSKVIHFYNQRGEKTQTHIDQYYQSFDDIKTQGLDALIIT